MVRVIIAILSCTCTPLLIMATFCNSEQLEINEQLRRTAIAYVLFKAQMI